MSCGCEQRQEWLNQRHEGLGDAVAKIAEPVKTVLIRMGLWR
jgi:hypothetical protein